MTVWLPTLLIAAAIGPALAGCGKESSPPHVGTTLFRVQDLDRKCWSADQLDLLKYRRAFQDLVPVDPSKVTVEYVTAFIEYVHACLDEAASVGDASGGNGGGGGGYPRKLLLTMAAADALGGFLHSRLLPRARRAFYAGCIGYSDVSALHELEKTLRRLLHTDGSHWRPPEATSAAEDTPQTLQLGPTTSTSAPAHTPTPGSLRRRRQPCAWHACPGLVTYPRTTGGARGSFVIPMPFLDDRYEPASIALPLRPVSLYKLEAPYSTAVIAKYYVAAIKCLQSNKAPEEEVKAFNEHVYARLVNEVVPHLSDEKLYAAFGAVMRVLETLVQAGVGEKRDGAYVLPAHLSVLSRPGAFDIDYYRPQVEEAAVDENASGVVVGQFDVMRGAPAAVPPPPLAQDVVLLSVATASLLWLLATLCLLCCWCCSSCCRRHADPRAGFFYNVFVSIYYTLKNTLSPTPSAEIRPEPSHQQVPPLATLPDVEPTTVARFRSSPLSLARQPPTSVTVSLSHAPPPTRTGSSLRSSTGRAAITTTATTTTTSTTSDDDYSDTAESEGQRTR